MAGKGHRRSPARSSPRLLELTSRLDEEPHTLQASQATELCFSHRRSGTWHGLFTPYTPFNTPKKGLILQKRGQPASDNN